MFNDVNVMYSENWYVKNAFLIHIINDIAYYPVVTFYKCIVTLINVTYVIFDFQGHFYRIF